MAAVSILSLNAGSSSLKFSLYGCRRRGEERLRLRGAAEGIGEASSELWLRDSDDKDRRRERTRLGSHAEALERIFDCLADLEAQPQAIGHRVVHGGPDHRTPQRIDAALLEKLRNIVHLAPLHAPPQIRLMGDALEAEPDLPQVACFDTAFHRRMPERTQRFPLPRDLFDAGVRRYGFHGLSFEYVLERLGPEAAGRTIIAHLGNGASMAAALDGVPVDTTMGLTPTGGLMMGTRSGDLDPGVLIFLLKERRLDPAGLERLVNEESGLLGVSGMSRDMKTLLDRRADSPPAAEAVELFCFLARKQIGALAAALEGLDRLVFTAGIGERSAAVRAEICAGLGFLGIRLDPERNAAHAARISHDAASCEVRLVPTNEELMIARHTRAVAFQET